MILTASIECNDRPSSNCHPGHSIKKRDTGRQEGAVAEKGVPSSIPLFDAEPFASTPWAWLKMQERNVRGRSASLAEEESFLTKGDSK
jgi:hypothetical protein